MSMTAWHLATNPDGDRSLWHGDTEVARPGDLRVAPGYQQMLFDLLAAVLVRDEETIERLTRALHSTCYEGVFGFSGHMEADRSAVRAALAALAPPQDAVGHVAHAMRRLEHIHDHVAEEVSDDA